MISILSLIPNSLSFIQALVNCSKRTNYNVTFMFHSFFQLCDKIQILDYVFALMTTTMMTTTTTNNNGNKKIIRYLSIFSFTFISTMWRAGTVKSTGRQGLFFSCWIIQGLIWPGLGDLFVFQNLRIRVSVCILKSEDEMTYLYLSLVIIRDITVLPKTLTESF